MYMCLQDKWKLLVTRPAGQEQYLDIFVPCTYPDRSLLVTSSLSRLCSCTISSGSLSILLSRRSRTVTYPDRSLLVTSSLSRLCSCTISSGSLSILLSRRSRTDMAGRCSICVAVTSFIWLLPTCSSCDDKMSWDMRFPTMWYVRPAKPQISLRICAVWSEPLRVAWIFYYC